jgi:hypothetical protein
VRRNPIENIIDSAVNEAVGKQTEGFSTEPGIGAGIRGKRLRSVQIWRPRKGPEKIMNHMVDELRKNENYKTHLQELHEKESKRKRRRRRGPRVLVAEPID